MKRFSGQTAFVTGGASGIGLACVQLLVEEGTKVVIGDLDTKLAQENADKLGGEKVVAVVRVDVAEANSVEKAVQFAEKQFGDAGIDLAINAAGIQGPLGPLAAVTPEEVAQMTTVNLLGTMYSMKYEIQSMEKRGRGGSIVNLASAAAVRPIRFMGPYSAAKHGVIIITSTSAAEVGPAGIRVNCVAPDYTDTPLLNEGLDRKWIASILPTGGAAFPRTSPTWWHFCCQRPRNRLPVQL